MQLLLTNFFPITRDQLSRQGKGPEGLESRFMRFGALSLFGVTPERGVVSRQLGAVSQQRGVVSRAGATVSRQLLAVSR